MPEPIIPAPIKRDIKAFESERMQFEASADGKAMVMGIKQFNAALKVLPLPTHDNLSTAGPIKNITGPQEALDWFDRLPKSIATEKSMPLIDFDTMKPAARDKAVRQALATLEAGVLALAIAPKPVDDLTISKIIQAAFGLNTASKEIRRPFEPDIKSPIISLPKNIESLIRDGELHDALRLLKRAAAAAASEAKWVDDIRVLGEITKIQPNPACPETRITLEYRGLGSVQPDLSEGARLVLRISVAPGACHYIDVDEIAPGFTSHQWSDSGVITLALPDNIASGPLQFLYLPPTLGGAPSAALISQVVGILGQHFPGWSISGKLSNIAAWHKPPVPTRTDAGAPGDPNWLSAGAPLIRWLKVDESGPVHPRGYVTLSWCVENADEFEIVAETAQGSEHPHELPSIQGPLMAMGSMRITVPCTRRWVGSYVLRAFNGNGCEPNPAIAAVMLESGFSHYHVGVGKSPIDFDPETTDKDESGELGALPPAFRLAGFADEMQRAKSVDSQSPLFARAFIVSENTSSPSQGRVAIVIADIWTCTIALKTAVLQRLGAEFGYDLYTADRLLIAGTHTHAAPGGYSDYFLYNFSIGGFDDRVFRVVVDAIVASVKKAHFSLAPGRVLLNQGDVLNCGEIRSELAYLNNRDAEPDLGKAVNRTMYLLRFERYSDNRGNRTALGMVNWHAIHPTSLGYMNPQISGDSKGWASAAFERDAGVYVAAFGNSCAGDISGNVAPGAGGQSNTRLGAPMGSDITTATWQANYARMVTLGTIQRDKALELFDEATEELSGPIAARSTFKDMSNISIAAMPGARTWPAAIGVSFGAGSSEDSEAAVNLGSVKIIAKIQEGITESEFLIGWVEFAPYAVRFLGGVVLALSPIAIAGPAGIAGAFLSLTPILVAAMGVLASLPVSRGTSWLFGTIGKIAFGGKVEAPQPSKGGVWKWLNPDELIPENTHAPFTMGAQHGVKPVMFPVGLWQLKYRRTGSNAWSAPIDCPLVPHVLPIQVMRIGQFCLAGVPAEFSTMAGHRLTQTLTNALNAVPGARIVIANYANGYSGYVTTNEEYDMQHYEGASTLYGPHTLEAYRQEFDSLTQAMVAGTPIDTGAPFVVPAIRYRPRCGSA